MVGVGGLWWLDDALTGRETMFGKMIVSSNNEDPSIENLSLRRMALWTGILMYLSGLSSTSGFNVWKLISLG
jgi:hypothetical protein